MNYLVKYLSTDGSIKQAYVNADNNDDARNKVYCNNTNCSQTLSSVCQD